MNARSLVLVTVDGLANAALGPYGSSWLATPGLNRFAAAGITFDRLVVSSENERETLRGMMGIQATPSEPANTSEAESLFAHAHANQIPTVLVTDSRQLAEEAEGMGCDEVHLIDTNLLAANIPEANVGELGEQLASNFEETLLGRLFASALERLAEFGETPFLLWIHASALVHTWDAPGDLRFSDDLEDDEELACETCVEGPEEIVWRDADEDEENDVIDRGTIEAARLSVKPPCLTFNDNLDPDLLLAWMTAYGAQVQVLDAMIELTRVALRELATTPVLAFAATSGFSLGEHAAIGFGVGTLLSNRVHVAFIVEAPGYSPTRVSVPLSTDHIALYLSELLAGNRDGALEAIVSPATWATRLDGMTPMVEIRPADDSPVRRLKVTPSWFFVERLDGKVELYLKPDDRFDVNDVAKLKPDIVEAFS